MNLNQENLRHGLLPGIIAGYFFLAYAGPDLQDLVGGVFGAGPLVGFILHLAISIVIAALYTALFLPFVDFGNPLLNIVVGGLLYGLLWWVIGGNIILPLISGGELFRLELGPIFYGHIVYGHTLAFIVFLRDAVLAQLRSNG
ncbi:MAG: hypothetical protein OXF83_03860 [Anaerolineaceae bacterium]|nr:hypothetical protein [Anaerolineaceae bacterium]